MTAEETLFGNSEKAAGDNQLLIELTAEVVGAYVSKNIVQASDLPGLISTIHRTMSGLTGTVEVDKPAEKPVAFVSVKKSVQQDNITCLDCGKKFKSLRRHLTANHGLTPEQYKDRWDLPASYPMVAPAYAEARSTLARQSGLGQLRSRAKSKNQEAVETSTIEENNAEPAAA